MSTGTATPAWRDRIAVVTGGSTGIGYALARRLALEGMDVAIAARDTARLDVAAERLRAETGRRIAPVGCDVTDREQVRALAARVRTELGPVDLLCANAGATTMGRYVDHTDDDWDWALALNLRGATHCIQAFYPEMVARGSGTILLTGSQTALIPDWVLGHGPYVAAKAGLLALAFALRSEAAEHGVRVSLLVPAATETDVQGAARSVPPGVGTLTVRPGVPAAGEPFFLSPDEVAARAVSGLKADAPVIATHAGMRPLVEDWFARVLAAYDAAAAWQPDAQ